MADSKKKVADAMMENSIPAGMQKHYIDNVLFGAPTMQQPAAPSGSTYKGGSDYIHKPPPEDQLKEFQRRAKEEGERNINKRR